MAQSPWGEIRFDFASSARYPDARKPAGKRLTFVQSGSFEPIHATAGRVGNGHDDRTLAEHSNMTIYPGRGPAKVRATLYLPRDLLEEARNAAVFLAGPPARLTLTKLAEQALRAELDRLRLRHLGGGAFPARDGELRGGRPIAA